MIASTLLSPLLPAITVRVAEPEMSPDVAVMMLVPMAAAVDRPVLLIVAMLSFNDLLFRRQYT